MPTLHMNKLGRSDYILGFCNGKVTKSLKLLLNQLSTENPDVEDNKVSNLCSLNE